MIVKAFKHTQNNKIKKLQLDILESMVRKYGIDSGYKSVPLAVVDFAIKAAEETNGDVRNSATELLKTIKSRGGSDKLKEIL